MSLFTPEALGALLWRSTLVLGIALLLSAFVFRRAPAHRYVTALVAVLSLPLLWITAPHRIELPVAPGPPAREARIERSAEPEWRGDTVLPAIGAWFNRPGRLLEDGLAGLVPVTPAPLGLGDGLDERGPGPLAPATPWFVAWMIVAALLGARFVGRVVSSRRLRRACRSVDDVRLRERLAALARRLGVRAPIALLEHDGLSGPAAVGVWNRAILVPPEFAHLDPREIDAALAHELLHHRRRDLACHLAVQVMRIGLWFQPLVHLAVRNLAVDRERAVDLEVVAAMGDRDSYVNQLVRIVRTRVRPRSSSVEPAASLGGRASDIRGRIEMLLNIDAYRAGRRPLTVGGAALALFAGVTAVLSIGPAAPEALAGTGEEQASPVESDDVVVTTAAPTDEVGRYRIKFGYDVVDGVEVVPRGGTKSSRRLEDALWTYDALTGRLTVRATVDDRSEDVVVVGRRPERTFFRLPAGVDPASIRVVFGDALGVRGVDYDFDGEHGILRFAATHSAEDSKYLFRYSAPLLPSRPGAMTTITAGNHTDPAAHRLLVGRPAADGRDEYEGSSSFVTNVAPTDDPRVFRIHRPPAGADLRMQLVLKSDRSKVRWLERGVDYFYDEKLGSIALLGGTLVDGEHELLEVMRMPATGKRISLMGPVAAGKLHVILNDRRLVEGEGFVIADEGWAARILDPEIGAVGAKFYVTADGWAMGNYTPPRALLDQVRADEEKGG